MAFEPSAELLERIGKDERFLFAALRANINQNGRALCDLIHNYRLLRRLAALTAQSFEGKHVLEMGSSTEPGLALILLWAGCARFIANNVVPLQDWLTEPYVRTIQLFLAGLLDRDPQRLHELLSWENRSRQERIGHLRPQCFVNVSPLPAEHIDLPGQSCDLVFSVSVLEHVRAPAAVLANCARLLRPGGWCFHIIDLRDHAHFDRPLAFLKLSAEEYLAETGGSENRLRVSDWLSLFAQAGLDVQASLLCDHEVKLTAAGRTDIVDFVLTPLEVFYPRQRLAEVVPWVDDAMRGSFDARFRQKSLADLSVLGMIVAARKNGA